MTDYIQHRVLAGSLLFPEGPVALADGSVLFVEIAGGTVSKVSADGRMSLVAAVGGGPNGLAIGPDGKAYVCNNGGYSWHEDKKGVLSASSPPGLGERFPGRIDRVDLTTGQVEVLYKSTDELPLSSPNDLVFDQFGGFYFTDFGRQRSRHRDNGALLYAKADGTLLKQVAFPMNSPNGVGISPDGERLYVSETETARLWAFDITGPGEIKKRSSPPYGPPHGGTIVTTLPGYQRFDSLAVEAGGNICIATMVTGCISVISPDGKLVEQVMLPDPTVTNICFGGPQLQTAYVTLSHTRRLVSVDWPRAGRPLYFLNR